MFQAQGTLLCSYAGSLGCAWLPFVTLALSFVITNETESVPVPIKDLHLYSGKDLFSRILLLQLSFFFFFGLKNSPLTYELLQLLIHFCLLISFSPQSSSTGLPSSLFRWDCVFRVAKPNDHFCYHTWPFRSIPNDVSLSLFTSFPRYHSLQFYTEGPGLLCWQFLFY